jgi:hypothetical protein
MVFIQTYIHTHTHTQTLSTIFWDVTRHRLEETSTLKMEEAYSSKMLVPIYQTTHVTAKGTIISVRNFSCLVKFIICRIRVEISYMKEAVSYSEEQKRFSTHKRLYNFDIRKAQCSFCYLKIWVTKYNQC